MEQWEREREVMSIMDAIEEIISKKDATRIQWHNAAESIRILKEKYPDCAELIKKKLDAINAKYQFPIH